MEGGAQQLVDNDDAGGQEEVEVHHVAAALGAPPQAAKGIEPTVGALDHPPLADVPGSWVARRDYAYAAEVRQHGLHARSRIATIQMHGETW